MESFHVICLQETWFNDTINDQEIIGNTNYQVLRNDRSSFLSNRKNGGGVLTLLHNSITCNQINIEIGTITEIQLVEIILPQRSIVLANMYVPPTRARTVQNKELARILQHVQNDFPNHGLIILGDFNTPTIQWNAQIDAEHILMNETELPPQESRLCSIMSMFSLEQLNTIPNSRGSFLDHTWSNLQLEQFHHVPPHLRLDDDSIYHRPISFIYVYQQTTKDQQVFVPLTYDFNTTKLNETKFSLLDYQFEEISIQDGAYYYQHDENKILRKINDFTDHIRKIQI